MNIERIDEQLRVLSHKTVQINAGHHETGGATVGILEDPIDILAYTNSRGSLPMENSHPAGATCYPATKSRQDAVIGGDYPSKDGSEYSDQRWSIRRASASIELQKWPRSRFFEKCTRIHSLDCSRRTITTLPADLMDREFHTTQHNVIRQCRRCWLADRHESW